MSTSKGPKKSPRKIQNNHPFVNLNHQTHQPSKLGAVVVNLTYSVHSNYSFQHKSFYADLHIEITHENNFVNFVPFIKKLFELFIKRVRQVFLTYKSWGLAAKYLAYSPLTCGFLSVRNLSFTNLFFIHKLVANREPHSLLS